MNSFYCLLAEFWRDTNHLIILLEYSLPRAKERLEEARRMRTIPDNVKTAKRQELQKRLQAVTISSSQVGDTRPIPFIQFSPNAKMIATCSWYVSSFFLLEYAARRDDDYFCVHFVGVVSSSCGHVRISITFEHSKVM